MFFVYELYDPKTNLPYYIGKGSNDRIYRHKYERYNRPKFYKVQKIISEYKKLVYRIVAQHLTEDEAWLLETKLISAYGRKIDGSGILLNIAPGGRNNARKAGWRHTDDAKRRISETQVGKIVSEETKKAQSEAKKGKYIGSNNPFFGKTHSDSSKKRMSEKKQNKPGPNLGKTFSENHKKKLSDARKGKEPWNKGQSLSESRKWYTDGVTDVFVKEGEQPCGFSRGRTATKKLKDISF